MRPGFKSKAQIKAKTKDRIARWVSFLALVALLAMATLPIRPGQHQIASDDTNHWSGTWHG
jgi:hypothetical protein